jgi:hypothetical protein
MLVWLLRVSGGKKRAAASLVRRNSDAFMSLTAASRRQRPSDVESGERRGVRIPRMVVLRSWKRGVSRRVAPRNDLARSRSMSHAAGEGSVCLSGGKTHHPVSSGG